MRWSPSKKNPEKTKKRDAGFKACVALEAVKGERAVSELAAEYGVHPTMTYLFKKALLDGAADILEPGGKRAPEIDEETVRSLHAKNGEVVVANEPKVREAIFYTERQALDRRGRREIIDKYHSSLSVGTQCRLLSVSRSSF